MDDRHMEQATLALILGVSASVVSAIMNGACRLSPRRAKHCGYALDLSPFELLSAQSEWELSLHPIDEAKAAAIQQRAQTVTMRVAKDRCGEIESLRRERQLIDERIAKLQAVTLPPPETLDTHTCRR